jgi:hypothetical protein
MSTLPLPSLAKKQTILSSSTTGPAVDVYSLPAALQGQSIVFESLLWLSAPSESLSTGYPAVPSQSYDWSSAPDWATWAAFDENGIGHWFLSRPILDENNGRWKAGVTERRSWPMSSNVALTRGWRASLGYRPGSQLAKTTSTAQDCSCPTASDTVITDVTGYIAVTMGDAVLLPEGCLQESSRENCTDTASISTDPGAVILLQESNDGIDWSSFGRSVLTSINSPVTFSYIPAKTLIRAVVSSIWGNSSFVTVTVSGLSS